MIIQIRGTSGSGKSTIMREVMDRMGDWQAEYVEGRKRPLYYRSCSEWPQTIVLGHYESPCGGCDTIGSAKAVWELLSNLNLKYGVDCNYLCEGLLLSEDVKWTSTMPDCRVLFLTTPLERCLKQITSRRQKVGNEKPLNPHNTSNRVAVIEKARVRLLEAKTGIVCRRASPEQASDIVLRWLRESPS